jgi:hypothetical protein
MKHYKLVVTFHEWGTPDKHQEMEYLFTFGLQLIFPVLYQIERIEIRPVEEKKIAIHDIIY